MRRRRWTLEALEPRAMLAAQLVISEFMAVNNGVLRDEDGDSSDWIELHNAGDATANLDGYFLTDDAADLERWRMPAVVLEPGGFLVVFASNKDRAVGGAELHTNFRLNGDGEYLALIEPDGATVVDAFDPQFPGQIANVSFGLPQETATLVAAGSAARLLVPPDGSLADAWTQPQFDDSSWLPATMGIGYEADSIVTMTDETIVYATASGAVGSQAYGGALGHDFRVNAPVTVTKLGVFDSGSDGLATTITAQLWSRSGNTGTLITEMAFTPASPGTLVGGDRFKPLAAPLDLPPGEYTVVAYGYSAAEPNGNEGVAGPTAAQKTLDSADGKISFVGGGRFGTAGQFPSTPDMGPANRYSAGTLAIEGGSSTTTVGQGRVLAYHNLPGAVGTQDYGGSLGHDFTVHEQITVSRLGVFDSGADGLATTLTAQLYSRSGNSGALLGQMTFTPGDPGELVGSDRLKDLPTAIVLPPGEYTMVAYGYNAAEQNGNGGGGGPFDSHKQTNDGGDAIGFVGSARYGAAGAFPTNVDSGPANRYSAGVFEYSAPAYSGLIATDIESAMHDVNASVYVRMPFTVEDPADFASLALRMRYEDGFVAYLNGVEIARRNAPAALGFDSSATAARSIDEARTVETINVTSHLGLLQAGVNVLAFHGLNAAADDFDFLLAPELIAGSPLMPPARYFDVATPGSINSSGFFGQVGDTKFDVDRGFFDAPFDVTITTDTPDAAVRYTTDGSAPTDSNGALYTGPIHVDRTTTLRAIASKQGFRPSNVDTQTYLFLDDVLMQGNAPAGYPSTWSGTPADYAMSQIAADLPLIAGNASLSVDEAREIIKQSLLALPTMSLVLAPGDMFDPVSGIYTNPGQRGMAWEKPTSIEYILSDGSDGFQIDAGIRIAGFTSRDPNLTPKHSLRLFFRETEYGAAKLNYPLFPDADVDEFNQISLRANARDSWLAAHAQSIAANAYIRDQWAKESQAAMGVPALAGRFVHLYINGIYWGVYNPTESPDAAFAATHFGGDKEDYDVVKFCCPTDTEDGDMVAWQTLYNLATAGLADNAAYQFIQGNNPDGTRNPAYEKLLDVDNLIDFTINGFYHASVDWPGNWYGVRRRGPDSDGFQFFTWDNDLAMPAGNPSANKTGRDNFDDNSPGHIDWALRQNAEYRLRFADHVQQHMFHDADLTPAAAAERWQRLADEMREPLIAESARWGDYRRDVVPQGTPQLFRPSGQWEPVVQQFLTTYFPQRTDAVLSQLRAVGLYPNVAAPLLSQQGGTVAAGYPLTLSASGGTALYTLDGSDPRLLGGAISPDAVAYAGAISIDRNTRVLARVRTAAGEWSALEDATIFLDTLPALRVTEIMYHPADPTGPTAHMNDDYEFIELQNVGSTPLDLSDFRFTGGVAFDFAAGTVATLSPGERVLVVNNFAAFASRYDIAGLLIAGEFDGRLDNGGEEIVLAGRLGQVVQQFTFDDDGPGWHPTTDGDGYSLVVVNPLAAPETWNVGSSWRPSFTVGGSPGRDDLPPPLPGDVNGDGRVDLVDLMIVQTHLGTLAGAMRSIGDLNGDAMVTRADAAILALGFGSRTPIPSPSSAAALVVATSFDRFRIERPARRVNRTTSSIVAHARTVDRALHDAVSIPISSSGVPRARGTRALV
ncbi:MAG: lamin tail domain-containing protein [Pirellulales bacterium]